MNFLTINIFVNVKHSFHDTNCFFQGTWSMMYDDVFIPRMQYVYEIKPLAIMI